MLYLYTLNKLHKLMVYSITGVSFRAAESFGLWVFWVSRNFLSSWYHHPLRTIFEFYFLWQRSPVKLIGNSSVVFHAAVRVDDSSQYSLSSLH